MLNRYKQVCQKIELCKQEIEQVKSLITGVSGIRYDIEKLKKSVSIEAPFSKYVLRLIALENEINKELEELIKLKEEIRNTGDEKDQLLLHYRYIEGLSWKEIAVKFDVNIRTVLRWHKNLKGF